MCFQLEGISFPCVPTHVHRSTNSDLTENLSEETPLEEPKLQKRFWEMTKECPVERAPVSSTDVRKSLEENVTGREEQKIQLRV